MGEYKIKLHWFWGPRFLKSFLINAWAKVCGDVCREFRTDGLQCRLGDVNSHPRLAKFFVERYVSGSWETTYKHPAGKTDPAAMFHSFPQSGLSHFFGSKTSKHSSFCCFTKSAWLSGTPTSSGLPWFPSLKCHILGVNPRFSDAPILIISNPHSRWLDHHLKPPLFMINLIIYHPVT